MDFNTFIHTIAPTIIDQLYLKSQVLGLIENEMYHLHIFGNGAYKFCELLQLFLASTGICKSQEHYKKTPFHERFCIFKNNNKKPQFDRCGYLIINNDCESYNIFYITIPEINCDEYHLKQNIFPIFKNWLHEKIKWNKLSHTLFPNPFKNTIKTLLIMNLKDKNNNPIYKNSLWWMIPKDVLYIIFNLIFKKEYNIK